MKEYTHNHIYIKALKTNLIETSKTFLKQHHYLPNKQLHMREGEDTDCISISVIISIFMGF